MYKLQKHSLTRLAWFTPETLQTTLEERNSTASMTMGPGETEIQPGDWIEDADTPGGRTIWRVKTCEWTPENGTRTITMEHMIRSLGDMIMFGEVEKECSAREMAECILSWQSDWRLGRFDFEDRSPWEFDSEKLIDALETVTGALDGAWWAYSMDSYPFTINIVKAEDYYPGFSEMRAGRNIQSMRHTIDRSQMYTRFYPIGKDGLTIAEGYLGRNESVYGIVCKVETDQSKETDAQLRAWAEERLRKHCEPSVTATISGLDLSRETGEDLDRMILGRKCRVPLPEYGTTITERVTRLQWRDRIKEPENVTVTLSNEMENVTSIAKAVSDQAASSSRGGRAGAKQAGEDHAWFVDTTDHVAMVAESIIGRDPATGNVNWSRVSEIIVDGEGIHNTVVATKNELVTQTSRIDQNERGIAAEIIDRTNADSLLEAHITATAQSLTSDYTQRISDGDNGVFTSLQGVITQTAESLTSDYTKKITDQNTQTTTTLRGEITQTAENLTSDYTKKISDGDSRTVTELQGIVTQTAESLTSDYTKKITDESGKVTADLEGKITQTAEKLTSDYTDKIGGVSSNLTQTASQIRGEVSDTKRELQGSIDVQAGRIGLVVEGTGDNAAIRAGQIVLAINDQTGQSEIKLDADKILAGRDAETLADLELPDWMDTTSGLIAQKATIVDLNALTARVGTLESDYLITDNLEATLATLTHVVINNGMTVNGLLQANDGIRATNYKYGNDESVLDFVKSLQIVQNGNNYTLQRMSGNSNSWVDVGSFSRATSLSGSWSGGTFTVTASPQGNTCSTSPSIVLDGNGSANFTVKVQAPNASGTMADTGLSEYIYLVQSGSGSSAKIVAGKNSDGSGAVGSIDVGSLYTDGQTAAGLTSSWSNNTFSVSRATSSTTKSQSFSVGARFNASGGSYYIESYKTEGGSTTAISNTSTTIKLGTSGSTSSTKVQIQNSSGSKISNTPELDVGNLYTNGWTAAYNKNGVPISAGTAASITVKVPPSTVDGTALSYTYTLGVDVNSAYLKYGNTTVATKSHTLYTDGQTAGKAAVTLNDPTWNSVSSLTSNRTVTVTTNGRPTQLSKSKTLYLTSGSWSNGSIATYIRDGSSSGTAVAQSSVSIPAASSTTWTNTTGRTWRADLTIGGVTRSSNTKDFSSYYTDGQDAAGLTLDATNKKVKRSTSSTVKEYAVTTSASISYDATTGKYTATANTKLGSTEMGSDTVTGGTEAWWDGYKDGWHAYYDDAKWMKHDETGSEGYIWIPAREKTAWNGSGASQWAKWYAPDTGGGSVEVTHDIRCSSTVTSIGTDKGSRANAGAISKSGLTARSYLGFGIKCGDATRYFYITVND